MKVRHNNCDVFLFQYLYDISIYDFISAMKNKTNEREKYTYSYKHIAHTYKSGNKHMRPSLKYVEVFTCYIT